MITLEPLTHEGLVAYRAVRLQALRDAPTAFGSTHAREAQFSAEEWRARVESLIGERGTCFLAMEDSLPCGIAAGSLDANASRLAWLRSMWIAPSYRRAGLASRLVSAVEAWAERMGCEELRLTVTSSNDAGLRLYERNGFTRTGVTEPYPNDEALFEYEMSKRLRAADRAQEW